MTLADEESNLIASCFPRALASEVRAVADIVTGSQLSAVIEYDDPAYSKRPTLIVVDGEELRVLSRAHFRESEFTFSVVEGRIVHRPSFDRPVFGSDSSVRTLISDCLCSRHNDGYVRMRHVEALLDRKEPWVCTFVLQLLGEYVIEIAQLIYRGRPRLPRDIYQRFAADNPAFIRRIRRRIVSYNAGFLAVAPSYVVLSELGLWDGAEGRQLLRRQRRNRGQIQAPADSISRPQ